MARLLGVLSVQSVSQTSCKGSDKTKVLSMSIWERLTSRATLKDLAIKDTQAMIKWLRKLLGLCEHEWQHSCYMRVRDLDLGTSWLESSQHCDKCKNYRRVKV